ncbi:phosphoribosyltransferase family protein [Rhodococcus artemisiae]|uniref:Phosphoribosyltransferase family protein n=1 Tax=Rhodococcus artemisiae TaxID=714159 RepID=A0ABU7LF10_9NOCA|nr:phosphoribosyltransferase family protein [Rhodococcus artemisiae]MEE2060123.1 phosphoribosyltransferase family protein [Rhodococcus artemisiae]
MWATEEFGLALHHDTTSTGYTVPELVEPGLRRNPRRAHLLVSTVLGKHLPTDPATVLAAGHRLGQLVAETLGPDVADAVVLGFAETATGLGHCVADTIGAACYLHSTRRHVPGADVFAGFEEGHSHATSHLLQPTSPELFANPAPLVLVDDEISTGATALDAIRAVHRQQTRAHYVVASLVDMRSDEHRLLTATAATELGARIDHVSLAGGHTEIPDGLTARVTALPDPELNPFSPQRGEARFVSLLWPGHVPDGGRHGVLHCDVAGFDAAVEAAADALAGVRDATRPAIVIGHEELMYLPLRLANALASRGTPTRFQTTTRSPAYVLDVPGYPLRRGFTFAAPEYIASDLEPEAPRFLYNAQWTGAGSRPELILVIDSPADTDRLRAPGGVLDVLTAAGEDVLVAVVPSTDPLTLRESRAGRPREENK